MESTQVMMYSTLVLFLGHFVAFDRSLFGEARMVSSTGTYPRQESRTEMKAAKSNQYKAAIDQILGTPTNRRRVVFMCQNQNYLIMKGKLAGTKNPKLVKKFGKFELQSYATGVVRIFNVRMRKFIAVDKKGKAYATRSHKSNDTLFKETEKYNYFHTYHSYYHRTADSKGKRKWYLAIKKDGRLKRPSRTWARHRSTEFLVQDFSKYRLQLHRGYRRRDPTRSYKNSTS